MSVSASEIALLSVTKDIAQKVFERTQKLSVKEGVHTVTSIYFKYGRIKQKLVLAM